MDEGLAYDPVFGDDIVGAARREAWSPELSNGGATGMLAKSCGRPSRRVAAGRGNDCSEYVIKFKELRGCSK